eukprot:g2244.t1
MSEASQGPRKKRRLSRLSLSYVKTTALSSGRNEDNRSGNGHSITIDPVQENSAQAVNGTEEDFETEESPTLVTLTQDQIINSDEDCSDNQFWTISDEEAGDQGDDVGVCDVGSTQLNADMLPSSPFFAVSPTQLRKSSPASKGGPAESSANGPSVPKPTLALQVTPPPSPAPFVKRVLGDGPMDGLYWRCGFCGNLVPQHYVVFSSKIVEKRIVHFRKCAKGMQHADIKSPYGRNASTPKSRESASASASPEMGLTQRNAFTVMMEAASPPRSGKSGSGGSVSKASVPASNRPSKQNAFSVLMAKKAAAKAPTKKVGVTTRRSGWGRRVAKDPSRVPSFKLLPIGGNAFPIVIDGFQYASESLSNVYFLSHFHSDHYIGLKKSFSAGTIYCTEVTAKLVLQRFKLNPRYVRGLKMDRPVKLECGVVVTLMNANHCPGSCIMLFQVKNKFHLHVGDFRFLPTMPLHPAFANNPIIDRLYLDTTYCDPKYDFPPQVQAVKSTISALERHGASALRGGRKRGKTLFLFGSYSIGKEKIFMACARHFGVKVHVTSAKMRMINCFMWEKKDMDCLTRNIESTDFHVVSMGQINFKRLGIYLSSLRRKYDNVVAIRPTGWAFGGRGYGGRSRAKKDAGGLDSNGISSITSNRIGNGGTNATIYGIAYSEHSSFSELQHSIRAFKPFHVIPTVNAYTQSAVRQMLLLLGVS